MAVAFPDPDAIPQSACITMQPGSQVGTSLTELEGHTSLPKNYQPGRISHIGPYHIQIHGYADHYLPDTDYSSKCLV